MAGEMFGTLKIPSLATGLISRMNFSVPELRRRIKYPAMCLSSLNSKRPFKQNPTGQRLPFMLMESDQKPKMLSLASSEACSCLSFSAKYIKRIQISLETRNVYSLLVTSAKLLLKLYKVGNKAYCHLLPET